MYQGGIMTQNINRPMLTDTTFDNHKNISYQLVELYHESKAFSVQYSVYK